VVRFVPICEMRGDFQSRAIFVLPGAKTPNKVANTKREHGPIMKEIKLQTSWREQGLNMEDRSQKLRAFFARLVTADPTIRDPTTIEQAFAFVKRELFAGPGPWSIYSGRGYVETPDDDLAFIYQDTLVAIDANRGINIGEPSSHAQWLDAIYLTAGDSVIQVGAGTGYYTAILAHLVGPNGRVHAYEIDADLASRASENLKYLPAVEVHARSGIADNLPKSDAIYVCAGITQPSRAWLDAMRPGARLLFPLQPTIGLGGMLLLQRPYYGLSWPARFVSRCRFICCEGPQDVDADRHLMEAFSGPWDRVRSFRIDEPKDDTCWFAGNGWWLSTAAPDPKPR
jgi:protein-L-isoaspartate(D-aspartate) O-methyltransferase